ncbi:MAG: pyridoxamine 5'-phosphate oxidase family protein [Lachnospiraceae bacterium]|nr:pyridoxamine 5'-phosphate oxidase family protein [Lachnospiraceae bacterium]
MAGKDLSKLYDFLKKAGTYYLATEDGDTPRVRPFGSALLYEDKIYILTAKEKDVSKQIEKNPKFEISAMDTPARWIRVSGELKQDNRIEVHNAILEEYPHLKSMYTAGDDNTNTLYLLVDRAVIYSFTEEPVVLEV